MATEEFPLVRRYYVAASGARRVFLLPLFPPTFSVGHIISPWRASDASLGQLRACEPRSGQELWRLPREASIKMSVEIELAAEVE